MSPLDTNPSPPRLERMWLAASLVVLALAVGVSAAGIYLPEVMRASAIESAYRANLDVAEQVKISRSYYLQNVISKVIASGALKATHNHKGVPGAIPLPATFVKDISGLLSQRDVSLSLVSPYPWPHRADRKLDDFEREAWEAFQKDPTQIFSRQDVVNDRRTLRVAMADRMTSQTCIDCHNGDPQSAKRDWKIGDVRAVMEVTRVVEPYLQKAEAHASKITWASATIAGAAGAALLLVTWLVDRRSREKHRTERRLHYLAYHDALTGVRNRAGLAEQLNAYLKDAALDNQIAIACVDLDRFKEVNDTYGHIIGDELLHQTAMRLWTMTKAGGIVARLGGDEFALVVPEIKDVSQAEELIAQVHRVVTQPMDIHGHQLMPKCSIGVALSPRDGTVPENLLKSADLASYEAKRDGGGWRFFETAMNVERETRRKLESELSHAVERNELELHFQPIFDMATNRIASFEALMRWNHPELGPVPPNVFIPIAEETRIIHTIGEWALRQACAEARTWPESISLAFNVSAVQLANPGFLQSVLICLASTGLKPQRLELEITETALVKNEKATSVLLQQFRTFGIRVALDDFGTGFSSLSYLQSYPFDTLKIDRRFTCEVATANSRGGMIFEAAVSLARRFGMETVAEGIETRQQLERVGSAGCTRAQGYLLARPLPAKDALALARKLGPAPAPTVTAAA